MLDLSDVQFLDWQHRVALCDRFDSCPLPSLLDCVAAHLRQSLCCSTHSGL